jgi:hypothetical protein
MKESFKIQKSASKNFNYDTDNVEIKIKNHKHPIFCFRYQHRDHDILKCTADEKVSFLEQIDRLSGLTWDEITTTQRHGLGSEKIAIASLKVKCPAFITEDVKHLLAIRFQAKKPFLVHRDRFVAHIIFIDNKFSIYKHG